MWKSVIISIRSDLYLCVCFVCSQGCDVHLSIQWSNQRNPDHYRLQAALRQRGTGATDVASWKKYTIRCCVNALTHVSVHPQESQFILDINLGAISRLETINVPNLGENTKGLELVCKVCLLFQWWRLFCFLFFSACYYWQRWYLSSWCFPSPGHEESQVCI